MFVLGVGDYTPRNSRGLDMVEGGGWNKELSLSLQGRACRKGGVQARWSEGATESGDGIEEDCYLKQ